MLELRPIVVGKDGMILGGNMRYRALQDLGWEIKDEWVKVADKLTDEEKKRFIIEDNVEFGEFDWDSLSTQYDTEELLSWGMDEKDLQIEKEVIEDEPPEVDESEPISKLGEVYQLGRHRLMCGDSTKIEDVEKLMDGHKADMVFTDPPYGIGKDIKNDNLNNQELHEFNNNWIKNSLMFIKENTYFYIWGQFQVLSRIWCEILLPLKTCAFRNYIVWKKRTVQGVNSREFRQFPENYEACLLFVFGNIFENGQWSTSPNAEFFPEMFEPLRAYLDSERRKMGWDIRTVKKMVGHSDLSAGDHWFGRSQWSIPTVGVYEILQREANGRAFRKQYDELRGFFDNTKGYTDIWDIVKTESNELHPTMKPVEVCARGIETTSQTNGLIIDLFGGSGSTLIACEQTGRICYMMELDPKYVDVIRKRYAKFIGKEEEWEKITPVVK